MKCPNKECNYINGFDQNSLKTIDGEEGEFYNLPITMKTDRPYYDIKERNVYACPKCKILFIDY